MKTAVIFPGIGYHTDKPLLYYSKKLAAAYGYGILEIRYSEKPDKKNIRGNREAMREAFEKALSDAERELDGEKLREAGDVLFISKSIGTVAAAAWARRHGIPARQILYTPVAETFEFAGKGSGIVFHGTADPWVTTETVKEGCRRAELPLFITEGANHSLETGNVQTDLANLQIIMRETGDFIRAGAAW